MLGTVIADIVLQLLSYVAETERDFIKQRQAEGIAAAKARGVKFGRAPKERGEAFKALAEKWERGEVSGHEAAKTLGVATSTFLIWARETVRNTIGCIDSEACASVSRMGGSPTPEELLAAADEIARGARLMAELQAMSLTFTVKAWPSLAVGYLLGRNEPAGTVPPWGMTTKSLSIWPRDIFCKIMKSPCSMVIEPCRISTSGEM